jgi:hypothetical protein
MKVSGLEASPTIQLYEGWLSEARRSRSQTARRRYGIQKIEVHRRLHERRTSARGHERKARCSWRLIRWQPPRARAPMVHSCASISG